MMRYCLIFAIISFACLIKESLGCSSDPCSVPDSKECMCSKVPGHPDCQSRFFGMNFPKIKLTADLENPTPECTEGGPCVEKTQCGKYGECIPNQLPSKIG